MFLASNLQREFGNSEGTVLLGATAGEWCETRHKPVEMWERRNINGKLAKVGVELTREAEARGAPDIVAETRWLRSL